MGNILKEYLTFTSKERSGLVVLVSLVLLVIIYLNLDFHNELDDGTEMAQFSEEMAALSVQSTYSRKKITQDSNADNVSEKKDQEPVSPYVFHEFDPNDVTDEQWKEMGLKQWQIRGIKNYREKAGDIRSPEQFEKLNVITDEFFEKVESHLIFGEEITAATTKVHKDEKEVAETTLSIELSIASAARLTAIRGIGPAFSKRIVKYRNWLGGFRSMDQLLEVYGLKDSLYQEIMPFMTLDTNRITTIDINTVMIAELRKHPYVKWNIASGIVNYRDQHGPYETVSAIKQTDLVSDELYRKIAPYFSVYK